MEFTAVSRAKAGLAFSVGGWEGVLLQADNGSFGGQAAWPTLMLSGQLRVANQVLSHNGPADSGWWGRVVAVSPSRSP